MAQGVRDDSLVQMAQARLAHVMAHLLQLRNQASITESSQQRKNAQPGAGAGAEYAAELLLLGRCMAQLGPDVPTGPAAPYGAGNLGMPAMRSILPALVPLYDHTQSTTSSYAFQGRLFEGSQQ
eukprot:1158512-Pelagomonas_calceolata.AAC.10